MATPLVLIIDDRPADQLAIASLVHEEGCQVLFAEGFAPSVVGFRHDVDIIICRTQIGAATGIEFMRQWHKRRPDASFFFLIEREDFNTARKVIKAGAAGYSVEPIDLDELRTWIRRLRQTHAHAQLVRDLQLRLDRQLGFESLIGQSKAMRLVINQSRAAAESMSAALIIGEPGTGKALLAEILHHNSRRGTGPFVAFHVSGLSVRHIEQELFGFAGSGPAGYLDSRVGRLDEAVGGSLFVNDVANLAAVTQARLLRALERRLPISSGGAAVGAIDVRVIAATSRKLDALAAEGRFSAGLYRRLSVNILRLPPLRERREDIPLFINDVLRRACEKEGRQMPTLESELLRFLQRFDWPGNVRQLRDCLESMLAMNKGDLLTIDDLPARIDDPAQSDAAMYFPAGMSLAELERSAVEQALAYSDGNRTRAAERLGISVRTLQRKLKSWSLEGIESESMAGREII